MALLIGGKAFRKKRGVYSFVATITAGTIVFEVKPEGGVFQTMTDGTISATGDGLISLSADTDYRVTIGAGNEIDLSLVELT
jgi:hypothetical protein